MTKRILPAALAIALIAALPLEAAHARGGGGEGGGGGGFGGGGDGMHGGNGGGYRGGDGGGRGTLSYSKPQDPTKQDLFEAARNTCRGAQFPSGATPRIDYSANSFTCFEPGSSRH